jgi:hypothetical protein
LSNFFPKLRRRDQYAGTTGISGYRRFRVEVADDCQRRCVYCDSRDVEIGGDPMMELDHFRPWSQFQTLKEEPTNLVFACRSCNGKKRNDWPAGSGEATQINGEGYVDPFDQDRQHYFCVNASGEVVDVQPPAAYVIRRLALNRPLLKCLRRRSILLVELRSRIATAILRLEEEIKQAPPEKVPLFQELIAILRLQENFNALH